MANDVRPIPDGFFLERRVVSSKSDGTAKPKFLARFYRDIRRVYWFRVDPGGTPRHGLSARVRLREFLVFVI